MKKYIFTVFLIVVLLTVFFLVIPPKQYLTFNGKITLNNETELHVQGIPQNIPGLRGEYFIRKKSSIKLYDNNNNILDFSSLKTGDSVEILYTRRVKTKSLKDNSYSLKDGSEIPSVQSITVTVQ